MFVGHATTTTMSAEHADARALDKLELFLNDHQLAAAEIGTPAGPAMKSTSCLRIEGGERLV